MNSNTNLICAALGVVCAVKSISVYVTAKKAPFEVEIIASLFAVGFTVFALFFLKAYLSQQQKEDNK